jgi:hypothetical protein
LGTRNSAKECRDIAPSVRPNGPVILQPRSKAWVEKVRK